jgi:MFS transporter, DHA2 family, multidrug resistance protein
MSTVIANPEFGLHGAHRTVAIVAVLSAMVLVVLDAAIANVALPTISGSLQVAPAMSIWVITAYQASLVMALLPCAALGESMGYRRVFTGGVVVFVGASVLCAMAPTLSWLVAGRFVQGLGGAAVMALGVALLRAVVNPGQLGAAIGWNALAVALASAAGPAIGAAIIAGAGWRWMFGLSLPLGALVLLSTRALPSGLGTGRHLDWSSVTLNAGGFAAFVVGAELLPSAPASAAVLLAAAGAALVLLFLRERPKAVPLVPIDLLQSASFRISIAASVLCFTGVAAALVALPFHLQHELGQSVWMTGLYLTPWPLTVALAAPIAARLAKRIPTAWLCAIGGICLSIGLAACALWPAQDHPVSLLAPIVLCGLGFGLFQVPNNQNMLMSAPRARSAAAGGMQGTARLTGQTTGALIMTGLFASLAIDFAPRVGLAIAAGFTLAAGLASVLRVGAGHGATLRGRAGRGAEALPEN